MKHLNSLSSEDYRYDSIIVSGDVTDSLELLREGFELLLNRFQSVCFVPGNHELWIRNNSFENSIGKFEAVLSLCQELGIHTQPVKVSGNKNNIWLVPLLSWYRLPEQGADTLFIEKITENFDRLIWGDFKYCVWPELMRDLNPADYFFQLNREITNKSYDAAIISYSHFLPRRDLMFSDERLAERYADGNTPIEPHPLDPHPFFNFSRVAGDQCIENQIRKLGSVIHVYGHQHRNRDRTVDAVRYISHCLGSPQERRLLSSTELFPKCIWEG